VVARLLEAHVHHLRHLLLDSAVCDPVYRDVVYLHRGRWLTPSHFFEGGSDGNSFLVVDKDSAKLRFGGGRCDDIYDLAHDVDESVEAGVSIVRKGYPRRWRAA